jgi:ribosomal protein S18 acetylase RimI-like enzyme
MKYQIHRIEAMQLEDARNLANRRLRETYSAELFQHFFEDFRSCFLAASHDGDLAGFILGVPLDSSTLRILMLAVDENLTRRGIGCLLLTSAESYASTRKMTSVSLEVGTGNESAIHFYQKTGFSITGMLPQYYEDRSDAFVMRKTLPA